MVFQKKGPVKGKQQTPAKPKGKKAFEEEEDDLAMDFNDMDSDDDDSDDSDEQAVMTPASKALKGKQPQSDKKVSFQIPGKNTPKSENSALAKKQSTPGKMSLKEFQGMLAKNTPNKNGKAAKRPAEDDDDEDDDDDDDDDNADLDMMLGDDDDEDDDDDDDEDDDDDDDDDDEDSEDESPKKKQTAKQLNQSKTEKAKTPVKILEKTPAKKGEKTPVQTPAKKADKTPLKEAQTPGKNSVSPKNTADKKFETAQLGKAKKLEAETRRERDIRTLYVGNLPKDITVTELKALSADIVNVILPHQISQKKRKNIFAFLEFATEPKAEENYKVLQKKKLRNEPLQIDFAGEKSKRAQTTATEQSEKLHNLRRLYVASIPVGSTMEQIAKFFPKCYQITLNTSAQFRTATVNYVNEKEAAEDLEGAQGAKISGVLLTVLYSVQKTSNKQKRKKGAAANQQASKKIKLEVKQEESDDDDDDDEDDDE